MSAHVIAQRNIHHTPASPVDRMMRKRSHLAIIDKRQRTADDDDDATTARGRTVAASARTTATTAAARTTADDDNSRTTAARATATTATTASARAASSSAAPASRTTAARGGSSNAVNPNLASTGASGSLAAGGTASPSGSAAAKSDTNNTGMIVGVIVVCLAVLAAMAAFVILRRKRRAQAIAKGGGASRAQKGKSEEMFGNVGPQDMAAVDSYRNRMESNYGPNGAPIGPGAGGVGAGAGAGAAAGAMAGTKIGNGFSQAPYSPNDKSRRSWDMSDDGRSFGNQSEVGLVGAAAYPGQQGKGRQGSGDGTYGSEPYSPQHAPPVPAIDPALAAIQAVGVDQNATPAGKNGDGQIYVVKRMFEPSLSDELIIYPGDRVRIVTLYDDGWCLTENLTSASPNQAPPRGVCPRDCIDNAPLSEAELASSPISAAGGANRISMPMPHPSLAPLQIDSNRAPQIEVSSPTMSPHEGPGGGAYGGIHEGRTRQLMSPQGQGQRQGQGDVQRGEDGRPKRHSSLIASRDAELFMALGEVLEKDQGRK